ncbi:recombinase family protein [Streptomyces sp. CA-251387]|uniref:recombinase family protein n=1 Tax=Streptomyces sp. CA-251387 TaxID=3240064 RepID=UPI003D8E3EBE
MLQLLRPGDTLKMTGLDRLSRSVLHLVTLGADLRERGIGLHVIEQGIDTTAVEGRAMLGMLFGTRRAPARAHRRQHDGRPRRRRARGRVGGRRPRLTEDQAALAQQLYDAREKTVQQIAGLFGVPRFTVYGHLDKTTTVLRQPKMTAAKS